MSELFSMEHEGASEIFRELADKISQKVVASTIANAKPVQQIALENSLPLSSTYKKIRKLCEMKLIAVDRIVIDDGGRKVFFYKSRVRSCQFHLRPEGPILQFEKN
jgi:hypothetical protein